MSMRNTLLCALACLAAVGCTTTVPVSLDQYSQQQKVVMTFKNDDVVQGRIVEGSEVRYTNEGLLYLARVSDVDDRKIVLTGAHLLSDDSPNARQAKLVKLDRRRDELAESSNPAPVPIDQIHALRAEVDTLRKMIQADREALGTTQEKVVDARSRVERLGSASTAEENDQAKIIDVRDRLGEAVIEYQAAVQTVNDENTLLVGAGIPPAEVDSLRARFGPLSDAEGELIHAERQYRASLSEAAVEAEEKERQGRSALLQSGRNKKKQIAAQAIIDEARGEQENIRAKQRERDSLMYPLVQRTRYRDSFEMAAAFDRWRAMKEQAKGYLRAIERVERSQAGWLATNSEAAALVRKWGVAVEEDKGVPVAALNDLAQRMGMAGRSRDNLASLEAEVQRLETEITDLQGRHDAAMGRMTDLVRQSGIAVASVSEVEQAIPAHEQRWQRYLEWRQLNDIEIPKYERLLQEVVPFAGPERVRLSSARLAVVDTLAPVVLPKDQIQSIEEIRLDWSKTSPRVGFWGYAAIVLGMLVSERS